MSKKPRSQHEIDLVKKEILDSALDLIIDEGFHNLTMRKLASKLNMTATTIYNYFSGKDEINLMIRLRGFEMLYARCTKARDEHSDPLMKMRSLIRAYCEFGISYPNYYDIMYNLHTPKYLDYVGTDLEPIARIEKETSLRNYEIAVEVMTELLKKYGNASRDHVRRKVIQQWCDVHGIISLYNSKLFNEIDHNPKALVYGMLDEVLNRTISFRDKKVPVLKLADLHK